MLHTAFRPKQQSELVMDPMQRFKDIYRHLSDQCLEDIGQIYSDNVTFVDPVTQHHGLAELRGYFEGLLTKSLTCSFDIDSSDRVGDSGYIGWSTAFNHSQLNSGERIRVEGFSTLKFVEGRIVHQRDYYDMGAMIYEQKVPLLGRLIIWLRRRLAA